MEDKREEALLRDRIAGALEEIAFTADDGRAKASERMKAMELLGKLHGLWKEPAEPDGLELERSKLGELLEQRRVRREEL